MLLIYKKQSDSINIKTEESFVKIFQLWLVIIFYDFLIIN